MPLKRKYIVPACGKDWGWNSLSSIIYLNMADFDCLTNRLNLSAV